MIISLKLTLGITAAIVGIAQYVPYIADIIKGKTRPHAYSWFVWGLPCGIIFVAQLIEGAAAGALATGITTLLCTVIFVLSLFYGENEITPTDKICLALALFALLLWLITKDPLSSVVLITISDLLGFIPTIRKSIRNPYNETMSTYVIGNLKWILSILALGNITFTICLYPIAMIVGNSLFVGILLIKRSHIKTANLDFSYLDK